MSVQMLFFFRIIFSACIPQSEITESYGHFLFFTLIKYCQIAVQEASFYNVRSLFLHNITIYF